MAKTKNQKWLFQGSPKVHCWRVSKSHSWRVLLGGHYDAFHQGNLIAHGDLSLGRRALGWLGIFPTQVGGHHFLGATFLGSQGDWLWELVSPRIHASPSTLWTVWPTMSVGLKTRSSPENRSAPGQFLGSYVVTRVLTTRLVRWLGWVFDNQKSPRKNEIYIYIYLYIYHSLPHLLSHHTLPIEQYPPPPLTGALATQHPWDT